MDYQDLKMFAGKVLRMGLVAVFVVTACPVRALAASPFDEYEETQLLKGDVFSVGVKGLQRVSMTDPEIADISDASATKVDIIGKKVGQTTLFVWDSYGKRTVLIRVYDEDLGILKFRVRTLLESAGVMGVHIEENEQEGKVVLSGALEESKLKTLAKVIEPFEDKVINLMQKEVVDDLIQIDMQVTELGTTLSKAIGVDWLTGTQTVDEAGVTTETDGSSFNPTAGEILPSQNGHVEDLFKLGKFYRTTNAALVAKVNALIVEGKARVLSKPRLVVVNGKEATLSVGGEIPVHTLTTSASGATTDTVEYKEYGITLAMTPVIRDGKVDILMNVEISEIDSKQSTENDVAFITRSAQTQLFLENRQTIVLAGMIKKRDNEETRRIPFLSKIPILGLLFQSKYTPVSNEDSEIVISLTPTILRSAKTQPSAVQASAASKEQPANLTDGVPEPTGRNDAKLPVITKNAASFSAVVPGGVQEYALAVQEKISRAVAYPMQARDNEWQGTVKLGLVIRKDGSLRDAFVKETSGYDVFDQDAVNTAHLVAPYPAFSETIREEQVTITLPIVYSLDVFLKNVAKRN